MQLSHKTHFLTTAKLSNTASQHLFRWRRVCGGVPAKGLPGPADERQETGDEQVVVVEDFADAPLFGGRALPDLGLAQSVERGKGGFALRIEQVEVGGEDAHVGFPVKRP